MISFFGITFIMSMVFATGAIEADNYLIGFGFVVLGLVSGFLTLVLQNKEEKKDTQLYYYKED